MHIAHLFLDGSLTGTVYIPVVKRRIAIFASTLVASTNNVDAVGIFLTVVCAFLALICICDRNQWKDGDFVFLLSI